MLTFEMNIDSRLQENVKKISALISGKVKKIGAQAKIVFLCRKECLYENIC